MGKLGKEAKIVGLKINTKKYMEMRLVMAELYLIYLI